MQGKKLRATNFIPSEVKKLFKYKYQKGLLQNE